MKFTAHHTKQIGFKDYSVSWQYFYGNSWASKVFPLIDNNLLIMSLNSKTNTKRRLRHIARDCSV